MIAALAFWFVLAVLLVVTVRFIQRPRRRPALPEWDAQRYQLDMREHRRHINAMEIELGIEETEPGLYVGMPEPAVTHR